MLGMPIGQISCADTFFRDARLAQPLAEPRPLGGAADQPDIGKPWAAQRRIDDRKIKRMAVGHHQTQSCRAARPQSRQRDFHFEWSPHWRHSRRKGPCAGIDPDDIKRQRRKRQNKRAADMARAEEIELAVAVAKLLD